MEKKVLLIILDLLALANKHSYTLFASVKEPCQILLVNFREDVFFLLQDDTAVHICPAARRTFIHSLPGSSYQPACLEVL